jgi:caffeoyl-CoA O-methyltransferase
VKEAAFLKSMVQKIHPRRVLEIGTGDGTSALAIAEALPEDGMLITCEINAGLAMLARKRAARSAHADKMDIRVGPALAILPGLTGPFDLIFIDADTVNYVQYYQHAMALLGPSGLLLIDNMQGLQLGSIDPKLDPAIAAIQELGRIIASDARLTTEYVAVRSGLLVVSAATQIKRSEKADEAADRA